MKQLGCVFSLFFVVSMLAGCSIFSRFASRPMTTIAVTMKADLKAGTGSYQLKIRKIVLCAGYDKYVVLGEISRLPAREWKGPLEDTVTFMGPVKPVQYFLVLTKEVQQELGPVRPVVETENGAVTTPDQGSYNIEDCEVFFIRP